ncbi:MAG: hypothetical protein IJI44_00595 [Erysipelotrichaceae bacterium]|nr:hypothetical protein [Erysipelotrichaceae bacterium]
MTERYDIKISLFMFCLFSFLSGLYLYAKKELSVEPLPETLRLEETIAVDVPAACRLHFEEEIYLAFGEERVLPEGRYISQDTEIVSIEGNTIKGVKRGTVRIQGECSGYLVHVSDLYTIPVLAEKEFLPCEHYTREENEFLDSVLEYEVKQAGHRTRAGVVAAARFLLLQFPYKLNYFFENGRLSNSYGVDGEGRYYHKGLYLSEEKKEEIGRSGTGPGIWGCKIYEYGRGRYSSNGFDCSGFIS